MTEEKEKKSDVMKAYFLAYTSRRLDVRTYVHGVLNEEGAVHNWVSFIPHTAIVISGLDVQGLCDLLRGCLDDEVWFLVSYLDSELVNGWLPADFWEFVNHPDVASLLPLVEKMKRDKVRNRG